MAMLSIVFIVASVVFLVRAMKVLYPSNYFWGNLVAYILGFVLPVFGGIINLAVALSVFIDSRRAIKRFP